MSIAVPRLPFILVSRSDVRRTRPALELAGYRCEGCGREDDLRVVEGYGQLVVLCPTCKVGEFRLVLGRRKANRLARGEAW